MQEPKKEATQMQEYRCYNCNHLLYSATPGLDVEIICTSCRRVNYPHRQDQELGLRGVAFASKSIDHRCQGPSCKRLLLRSIGMGKLESRCRYCHTLSSFDTAMIRSGRRPRP